MVYLLGWAYWYTLAPLLLKVRKSRRLIGAAAFCTLGLIAVLRGAVGTDTAGVYEPYAQALLDGTGGWNTIEPLFRLTMLALTSLTDNAAVAVRLVAVVYVILQVIFFWRSTPLERQFQVLYFVPIFFFEQSMNTLRVGLAISVLMLALQYFRAQRRGVAVSLGICAALLHYSILIIPLYLVLVMTPLPRRMSAFVGTGLAIVLGLIGLFGVAVAAESYLVSKVSLYTSYESPSAFSGLSSIAVVAVLLAGSRLPDRFGQVSTFALRYVLVTFAFCLTAYGLVQFSYAGLRVLDLITFGAALVYVFAHSSIVSPSRRRLTLLVAGFLGAIFTFRNFLNEPDHASPFLPYEVFF